MPELRKDPVTTRWVVIAKERARRPEDFSHLMEDLAGTDVNCPFCPGREDKTPPELAAVRPDGSNPNGPGWEVRVIPNRFPALVPNIEPTRDMEGPYDMIEGFGAHEVIIEGPDHFTNLQNKDVEHVSRIQIVMRDRLRALYQDPRLEYVLIFKNYGSAAGSSLVHPHIQIIATPIVPKQPKEELKGAEWYYKLHERCIYCDVLHHELKEGTRIVYQNDDFVVMVPYASSFPFETFIIPKKHSADFAQMDDAHSLKLADAVRKLLLKLMIVLKTPPYNLMIHTAQNRVSALKDFPMVDESYHWHIEVIPRLTKIAGFEWGSGFYINPMVPEEAARILRETAV